MTFIATSVSRKLLYRTAVPLVILCTVAALLLPAAGQFRKQRRQSQLRALGLIEIGPNKKPRLIPIMILVEGKFYDAGIYRATPVPMALEPGTVYEGFHTGTPVGLFTISTPETLNGNWRAQGSWRLEGATSASASSKKPGSKSAPKDEDERPVLRRPGSSTSPSTPPAPTPAPSSGGQTGSGSTTASAPSTSTPASTSTVTQQSKPQPSEDDSGRPTLRRGRPGEEQADLIPEPGSPRPTAAKNTSGAGAKVTPPATLGLPESVQSLPAISDTDGPESHPYTYELRPEDRQAFTKKVTEMASAAISKFERARDPRFSSCVLADVSMRAFDLDFSNEPDLVFGAHCPLYAGGTPSAAATARHRPAPRVPPAGEKRGEAWVTVVARVDLYGEPRQLFASVTDTQHLDEVPRYELIDAVDADGDGRAEFLFREINDTGRAFVVFRAGADKLYPLFEGASGQ